MARREGLTSASEHITLDLSGGFNEAACVAYAMRSTYASPLHLFNKRALYRALPVLLDDPAFDQVDRRNVDAALEIARTKYRPISPGHNLRKSEIGITILEQALHHDADLQAAKKMLKPKFLKRILNQASTSNRSLFEAACGAPPTNYIILCDECTEPALVPAVQKLFGKAWNVDMINMRGEKDPELVKTAIKSGVRAIFTKDKRDKKPSDLGWAVMDSWTNPSTAIRGKRLHLVLLPHETKAGIAALRTHRRAVRKYLQEASVTEVLSLVDGKPRRFVPSLGLKRKNQWHRALNMQALQTTAELPAKASPVTTGLPEPMAAA